MTGDFTGIVFNYTAIIVGIACMAFIMWYLFFHTWPKPGKRVATVYLEHGWTPIKCETERCQNNEDLIVNQHGHVHCQPHKTDHKKVTR